MSDQEIFRVCGVSFAYPQGQRVLQDVNLSCFSGQKIGLFGPNGSGKTTLFHLITGLLAPCSGQILFHGQAMGSEKDFQALRREVGLVLQNAEDQLFHPTVLDDVAFGPLNLGLDIQQARQRALETLADLGLAGFEERLTHRLSGGEKKLVSLATILAMQPKVLLLDEPTTGLDLQTQGHIVSILTALPTAQIIISHDWDFLAQTTNNYLTIKDGQLVADMPYLPHEHVHAHPLGHEPHCHLP